MPNVTSIKRVTPFKFFTDRAVRGGAQESGDGLWGGMAGFIFYWLACALPVLVYGANALFFLLYTWPFFLALMPVSVLIGIVISVLLPGRPCLMILCCGLSVFCLFWLVFSLLTGW